MEQNLLNEYRCSCGKLLFKGFVLVAVVEAKCKRCGQTKTFRNKIQGVHSFMLVVDGAGKILDACQGVAALECSRQYVIGKSLLDILSLARDTQYQEILPTGSEIAADSAVYQIKNNTLLLRDRKMPLETYVVPVKSGSLYHTFNVIKEI